MTTLLMYFGWKYKNRSMLLLAIPIGCIADMAFAYLIAQIIRTF